MEMSNLSGYDSEAVGFDSITRSRRSETTSSTQTAYEETGTACQTNFTRDCGVTTAADLGTEDDILREYPPPGLNEFLRKVVPSMLEQLDQKDQDFMDNSSDDDVEETVVANLFQEIQGLQDFMDNSYDDTVVANRFQEIQVKQEMPGLAAGDFEASVLSISWSCAGNSLAMSLGTTQHEDWCQHNGVIRIYTVKRAEKDKLVHYMDLTEKSCVTAVKYHPSLSALLAYGTATGEIVIWNLKGQYDGFQLGSPSGCHGSKRVSYLSWADPTLANAFLTIQINKTGKRRRASDQILITAGSDGTINIFQVNAQSENTKVFENVLCYTVNGSPKTAPDITCFDFIKTCPLKPTDERVSEDIFVVGCKSGQLLLCKIKTESLTETLDPVYDKLNGHEHCVLDISFSYQRPGIFASVSIDSQVRVYDVKQSAPLKVVCLNECVTCLAWLPNQFIAVLSLNKDGNIQLGLVSAGSGRTLRVSGASGTQATTALAVNTQGTCRVAAGDTSGIVRLWDLPTRHFSLEPENLEF